MNYFFSFIGQYVHPNQQQPNSTFFEPSRPGGPQFNPAQTIQQYGGGQGQAFLSPSSVPVASPMGSSGSASRSNMDGTTPNGSASGHGGPRQCMIFWRTFNQLLNVFLSN
jgi:hypothetical protein